MDTVWIFVCDSARARLFETRGEGSSWQLLETLTHEESRAKAAELASDHAGRRSSEGASVHHNALAPASSPKEVEKHSFAQSLASTLDRGMRARRFLRWVLVAPPHFVGLVKAELTPELEKHLLATVDKDLAGLETSELVARLKDVARLPADLRPAIRETTKNPH
jgi:protein required for attachment to host cells